MKTMSLLNAFNEPMTASSNANPMEIIGNSPATRTVATETNVVFINYEAEKNKDLPEGHVEIDELVIRHEKDERRRIALEEARRWAAETFHQGKKNLASLRLSKGLSQASLAEKVGTSQSHIAKIENGTCAPQITTAAHIADAIGIDMNQFYEAFLQSGNVEKEKNES